ncbi:uncharacterized protein LOC110459329 [Mizuhopecten yessoensis]|uniref:Protein DP71L n=1 Tax=Mizuhopecten yessoensis TaxID=6573 RepID=A0A210Q4Q9_MIZYE|nr:uncharacterized protein LOC110459329 [Mizuhopecten yessoensis]OWF43723.1 Protein DP71L [Mizuhopecten yessoensis]
MNPYGTKWRCKDKKHPVPEKGHVTPVFLRLDSTGEITSGSCSTDRYIPDMATLFDSAFMKLHGTKRGFINYSSAPNVMPMNMESDFVLNEFNQTQAMNSHSSPYSAPHWGCRKKTPTRPNSCAFSNLKNSTNICTPEFKHFQHQKTGFHPAVTGHHLGQRYPNRASHRGQHVDGHRYSRRPRYSFTSDRVPSDCSNWRKPTQENILQDDKLIIQDRLESTTEPLRRSDSTSETLSHSKNVIDNDKTPKPVINIECAMPSQKKSCEDLQLKVEKPDISTVPATKGKELDAGSNGHKSASVQIIDWFECDQSEEIGGSDVPQRIGFRVRTVSIDSETSNDSSINNKTLQREASVISDIFQPDDNVIHVTCMFEENDLIPTNKDNGTSSEIQPNEHQSCSKDDHRKIPVGVSNTESPQSSNCAEKKSEPSDLDKDYARRIVLLVRNSHKKGCRPSAKKRRRSKARKEDLSEIPSCQAKNNEQKTRSQEKKCKEKGSSARSGTTKNSGSANTVAFLLGINSNSSPVSPLQQHSFLVSFDSESDDFSEDSGDDFSDSDGVDELDFFSCPLQLNVFCPVKQPMATNSPKEPSPTNGCESDKRQQEILDVNLKWSMNFSISQRKKSKSKVTFAEGDQLCTVYDLDDEDRKSHWEECVRDRERFQRRITEVGEIMKPVLSMERRDRIYHQYLKQN